MLARLRTAPRPARALADVFKRLAQNATAQTRGLTRALGVSGLQQQDAQEYLRLLVGELCEDAALGDRVRSCYEGRAENFLEATDAEAERLGERPAKIREEAFLDVSLDVEAEDGTVEGALQRYLEPEILDGENRWASPAGPAPRARASGSRGCRRPSCSTSSASLATTCGTRSARSARRCACPSGPAAAFERAAPVEEAAEAEAGEEAVAPAGAEEAPDDDRDPRLLHAVVVHAGGGRGGHYYAYADPRSTAAGSSSTTTAFRRRRARRRRGGGRRRARRRELGRGHLLEYARVRGAAARAARWCCRAALLV